MFLNIGGWLGVVVLVIDLTIRVLAIIVVPRNRKPTAGMAWLLAIFLIPFAGIFVFLLIGNPKLPRKRRRMQEDIDDYIRETTKELASETEGGDAPEWFKGAVRLNRTLSAMPLQAGNAVRLVSDYQASLDQMAEAIDQAVDFVHVEFYILQCDQTTAPFFDALERACARGVAVHVLLDHWANLIRPNYRHTRDRLTSMGADWKLMLPLQPLQGKFQRPDLRNHRKILVVDGRTAVIGSQNVLDRSYNKKANIRRGLQWEELVAVVEGPAVGALNAVFLADWYAETEQVLDDELGIEASATGQGSLDCQIVPSGPGYNAENNLRLFLALLYAAQRRIVITSPYFVPDESLMYAVTSAVQRGVAVDLFVSEIGDQAMVWHAQRSYYEELLRAGVRIYLYPAPYILHSKCFSIDDDVAVVGSSNMDMRSFGLNQEISMMVRGASFVSEMRAVEDRYRAMSKELTLDEWLTQPLRSTVLDNLARLTSALQ
ncbi:cardiolipin synthase [Mycetocola reblochoni]|uniref:Cardiolipin synthase n=2 Tax=Mycetocola reblochoni TaxID=331618 RepID=A0A1R4I6W3_9MICO|nr:cardiolipin synthase [Mycetocola reblochoni]RLP68905.1 cardiolipin synthase [Mycetocola reblochoni]SJN15575.1 Cardiolipin synthetase [Mycetocola reblochoni REB411]